MRYKSYVVEFNKVQYKATMIKISLFLLHGAVCTYFRLNYSILSETCNIFIHEQTAEVTGPLSLNRIVIVTSCCCDMLRQQLANTPQKATTVIEKMKLLKYNMV